MLTIMRKTDDYKKSENIESVCEVSNLVPWKREEHCSSAWWIGFVGHMRVEHFTETQSA